MTISKTENFKSKPHFDDEKKDIQKLERMKGVESLSSKEKLQNSLYNLADDITEIYGSGLVGYEKAKANDQKGIENLQSMKGKTASSFKSLGKKINNNEKVESTKNKSKEVEKPDQEEVEKLSNSVPFWKSDFVLGLWGGLKNITSNIRGEKTPGIGSIEAINSIVEYDKLREYLTTYFKKTPYAGKKELGLLQAYVDEAILEIPTSTFSDLYEHDIFNPDLVKQLSKKFTDGYGKVREQKTADFNDKMYKNGSESLNKKPEISPKQIQIAAISGQIDKLVSYQVKDKPNIDSEKLITEIKKDLKDLEPELLSHYFDENANATPDITKLRNLIQVYLDNNDYTKVDRNIEENQDLFEWEKDGDNYEELFGIDEDGLDLEFEDLDKLMFDEGDLGSGDSFVSEQVAEKAWDTDGVIELNNVVVNEDKSSIENSKSEKTKIFKNAVEIANSVVAQSLIVEYNSTLADIEHAMQEIPEYLASQTDEVLSDPEKLNDFIENKFIPAIIKDLYEDREEDIEIETQTKSSVEESKDVETLKDIWEQEISTVTKTENTMVEEKVDYTNKLLSPAKLENNIDENGFETEDYEYEEYPGLESYGSEEMYNKKSEIIDKALESFNKDAFLLKNSPYLEKGDYRINNIDEINEGYEDLLNSRITDYLNSIQNLSDLETDLESGELQNAVDELKLEVAQEVLVDAVITNPKGKEYYISNFVGDYKKYVINNDYKPSAEFVNIAQKLENGKFNEISVDELNDFVYLVYEAKKSRFDRSPLPEDLREFAPKNRWYAKENEEITINPLEQEISTVTKTENTMVEEKVEVINNNSEKDKQDWKINSEQLITEYRGVKYDKSLIEGKKLIGSINVDTRLQLSSSNLSKKGLKISENGVFELKIGEKSYFIPQETRNDPTDDRAQEAYNLSGVYPIRLDLISFSNPQSDYIDGKMYPSESIQKTLNGTSISLETVGGTNTMLYIDHNRGNNITLNYYS
jgi:hypothetical protein